MKPKLGKTKRGEPLHYSVGAIIKKNGKYLLIDRKIRPFGFAGIAGHVDQGETPIQTLRREVKEESGLKVKSCKLVYEGELVFDKCVYGIKDHYWYVLECNVSGRIKKDKHEEKSIAWYSKDEIKKLKLEKAWKFFFKKLGIL